MEEHKASGQDKEEEAGELGARKRTLTEKGLAFKLDQLLKEVESHRRAHMKLVREYEENEQTIGDVTIIDSYIRIEEEKYNEYKNACNLLLSLDSTANVELSLAEESHVKTVDKMLCRIKEITEGRLVPQQSTRASSVKSNLKASSIRSTQKSNRTRSSNNSKSTHSSVIKAKLVATAAKLKVDKLYQEQEAQFELQRTQRELEFKQLQLEKELVSTEAQIQAIEQIEDEGDLEQDLDDLDDNGMLLPDIAEDEGKRQHLESFLSHSMNENKFSPLVEHDKISDVGLNEVEEEVSKLIEASPLKAPQTVKSTVPSHVISNLNPTAQSFRPQTRVRNDVTGKPPENQVDVTLLKDVVDILSKKHDLVKPHPAVFKGDLLEYNTWVTAFEMFIEQNVKVPAERIFYLSEYTDGPAKESIQGLLRLHTEEAFIKAKSILKERFGDSFKIAQAYRTKLKEWPKMQINDGLALQKFSDFLQNCLVIKEATGHLKFLDDPETSSKLLSKLPIQIVIKWNSKVVYQFDTDGKGYPPFEAFCVFISQQAKMACHPIASANAVISMGKGHKADTNRSKVDKTDSKTKTGIKSFATTTGDKQGNKTETKKVGERTRQNKQSKDTKPKEQKDQNDQKENVVSDDKQIKQSQCLYCTEMHDLDKCKKFDELSNEQKIKYANKERLCRACLHKGHIARGCTQKCKCDHCKRQHPSPFHDIEVERFRKYQSESEMSEQTKDEDQAVSHRIKVNRTFIGDTHSMIVPVYVHHCKDGLNRVKVYALLDEQSDACFIKESTLNTLKATGTQVHLQLATVLGEETVVCTKVQGLVVQGVKEQRAVALPPTYSREIIPARKDQIPRKETAQNWPHLNRIEDELMPYDPELEIGLIIGISCTKALKPKEVIPGKKEEPFARRTELGWGIVGKVHSSSSVTDNTIQVYRTLAQEVVIKEDKKVSFLIVPNKVKEVISPLQIKRMFETDFNDRPNDERAMSYNDQLFLTKMKEGKFNENTNHYEMPLPFKNEKIVFDNNRTLAEYRLERLKAKIKRDKKYHQDYLKSMEDMIHKGYAEEVPSQNSVNGFIYYLCHHGVYHPRKPEKLRVVFDCSATYKKQSLNSQLLQGPDLTNNLTGVLCRFRQEEVAFVCDIEAMYHQVNVFTEHRDVLRFLWWKDGILDNEPIEYRMTVHLFGATSSPSVANYTLKKVAEDNRQRYGSKAADFVKRDFYVDDGLKSVSTAEEASQLINDSKAMCKQGGFKLNKFLSNSKEVLAAISPDERAGSVKSLDLNKDTLPIERTLGVEWCVESDSFQFRINLSSKPVTRRGILSTVSSIYDPLGLVSPFILTGKRILQDLCKEGVSWDEDVSVDIKSRWEQWKDEIHLLQNIKIPRCYKPESFGNVREVELHHFSDASENGYGQCSYIRLVNDEDKPHCALVMAKARVTPLRAITIPRLELAAAVVSVRVHSILERELDYTNVKETFWTDSKVVLGYINSDAKRFHVYVANRVQQIRDKTSTDQWKYVETKSNPADFSSRGMTVQAMINNEEWWNGPKFLWQPLENNHVNAEQGIIADDDPEVKKVSAYVTGIQPLSFLDRLKYFSMWHNAKRATAVCLRLQKKFKGNNDPTVNANNQNSSNTKYVPVTSFEMRKAEEEIIRQLQAQAFPDERVALMNNDNGNMTNGVGRNKKGILHRTSQLYKLDPFMDKDGILRVGGRIRRANIDKNQKHPAILPKKSHITELLICHYHNKIQHQGRGMTLNEIRGSGYWIIGGSSLVSKHIHNCVKCRKYRGSTQEQKMADLPVDRLESSDIFTFSCVDYYGPFYIKEKRSELKRYGVLFTCMSSRAIHLETANSMTTDSFINAYRRFIGRRGPISQLRSDQGSNFIGTKNEFFNCLDHERIRQELLKYNCDWIEFKMNVPHSSHMGGVWERQIRTVRNVLSVLLTEHGKQLDDESLRTFMIEAEAIVNGRPLTVDTLNNSEIVEPLTPNMLLTMKSKVVLPPPGNFEREDLYARKRWRRVQYLANEFWSRWKREYLQSLQVRSKWNNPQRNLQINDIVIVKDDNLPRNRWKLGSIEEVYLDDDGLVRKVKLRMSDPNLDSQGKRVNDITFIERPIHKLVLLVEAE